MIFRRKIALLVPILFGVLLVAPLWLLVPPKYRASALVRRKDLAVISSAPSSLVARGEAQVPINTLRVEILTWTNLDKVIRQLKMDVDLKSAAQWQDKYEELRKTITIRAVAEGRGVDLIEISAISNYPPLAQKIANAIADNYVEESQKQSRLNTETAVKFFQTSAAESLEKLRRVEMELEKYQQRHLAEMPDVRRRILDQLLSLHTAENVHTLQLTAGQSRLTEIEKQLSETPLMTKAMKEKERNPGVVEMQNRRITSQKQLEAMLLQLTPEHPMVKKLQAEIALIDEQLKEMPEWVEGRQQEIVNPAYDQLTKDKLSTQQDIRTQESSLRTIRAQIAANEAEVRSVQDDERRYNDLQRQRAEYEEVYNLSRRSLLTHRQRLMAETGPYGAQVDMVARALEPTSPYRMDRVRMALACLAGGLAMGIALMFTLEFADHSLRSADDAAEFLNVPVLCSLSTLATHQDRLQQRRKHILYAAWGAGAAAAGTLTLALMEFLRPGTLRTILTFIRGLVG